MSLAIGNNLRINESNLKNSTGRYESVREYSGYLMGKYSCLTPGKNTAVSVTSGMLRKAMADEKTAKWLEKELGKADDYIKQAQQAASARGCKLLSATIEFGEEYTTMCTMTVTDTPGTDEDIDKWLEKVKEDEEKQKVVQKKADKKASEEKLREQRIEHSNIFKGPDLKSVTDSFIREIGTLNSTMNMVSGFDMIA